LTERGSRSGREDEENPPPDRQDAAESLEKRAQALPEREAHEETDESSAVEHLSADFRRLNDAPDGSQLHETRERGEELQDALDQIEFEAAGRRYGPWLLGVVLAIGVIVGGLTAFLMVFVLLVGVIR
jgi:hypothetical protein